MEHDEIRPKAVPAVTASPVVGENLVGLREYLVKSGRLPSDDAFARVQRDAVAILRSSRRFDAPDGTRTGLVVGYVQSGKTQSMTAVSALARDNGCRIVILLAGVTNILLEQSATRFKNDLRSSADRSDAWRIFNSADGFGATTLAELQGAISEWSDPQLKEQSQTLLFVVLKNHAHLDQLWQLLHEADLKGVPAIVIDDEADQAGLNTDPDSPHKGSTTFRKIKRVREALPHHTYLQYTATPQAPLLIALDDILSPEFAELVEPGDGYTGGKAFFGAARRQGLVLPIPEDDQFKAGEPPSDPPESLLAALRVFFVGCAVSAIRGKPVPRSMLVHPSAQKKDHKEYLAWIVAAVRRWTRGLRSKSDDDRKDVLDELREGYDELAKTDTSLPPFEQLSQELLLRMTRVSMKEVNSDDGTEIDWKNSLDHILVGGEKLNRGFTVEGLMVTYMPRGGGGMNADTIQQRARFFGYKAGYLSLCRLYLHPEVISAFESYVRHEEDVRKQLEAHRGQPLKAWRRAFFLDAALRPTRTNVIRDPYFKISRDKHWFVQRFPHYADLDNNTAIVRRIEDPAKGPLTKGRPHFHQHTTAERRLKDVYEELISFNVRDADVPGWYAQLVTLADIAESDPNAKVLLVGIDGVRNRSEDVAKDDVEAIPLQQGRSSSEKEGRYPGDKEMCVPDTVTVQIHWLNVGKQKDEATSAALPFFANVPALAIHIPDALRRDDVGVLVPS